VIVEPPSIALSPTLRNLAGTPTYSVVSGSATLVPVGDKVQVIFGSMGSDRVTIRASISDGGITYQDQMTLVKLVDGGTAISHVLTNEMHALFSDQFGNIVNYMGASGQFQVWKGATEVTNECTFSIVSTSADVIMSISNIGRYALTGMPASLDTLTVVLRATYEGANYDETFTVTKIKAPAGSGGDPAQQVVNGMRLPMNFTVATALTTWSNLLANQAVIPYNGTVRNDIVTEYNNVAVPPYKETRFWDGKQWLRLDQKLDGNLLVTGTVSADALSANAVDAITGNFQQLVTDQITANNATIQTETAQQISAASISVDQLDVANLRLNGVNINPDQLGTGHMIDHSITVPVLLQASASASLSAGQSWDSGTMSADYGADATVMVQITISVEGLSGTNGFARYMISAMRDGGGVSGQTFSVGVNAFDSGTFTTQIPVTAGTHTWGVQVQCTDGSLQISGVSASFLGTMK
jgi:hypothetical protein